VSQPSYGPGQQPWGQPQGGPQQPWGQPAWGPPPTSPGSPLQVPLLVLGLVAGVLGLLGSFLPTFSFPGEVTYSPLSQGFGDGDSQFLAAGLALLAGVALLVAGALLTRPRPALGTGLLVLGAGLVADRGVGQLLTFLQALVTGGNVGTTAVGGVLLMLAGVVAVVVAVLGVLALTRLARPQR